MRVTSPTFNPQRRRGVILLVVLAMLTLLTVIGVTFVLYSDSAESTARIAMEGEKSVSLTQPASWPTDELMAYAFGQLIYDAEDDSAGQQSNLRGHSLARDIYGYYYDQSAGPLASSGSSTPVQSKAPDNDRPFRGTGRLDPDKDVVNFTTFKAGGTSSIRDPERKDVGTGSLVRTNPAIPNAYVGGFNPPYTFADRNHVFLANIDTDPTTGNIRVTEPSFVRLASLPNNTLDPANPYWTDPSGDPSKSVRPRPVNHNGQFPAPASATGDVRNLPWGTPERQCVDRFGRVAKNCSQRQTLQTNVCFLGHRSRWPSECECTRQRSRPRRLRNLCAKTCQRSGMGRLGSQP